MANLALNNHEIAIDAELEGALTQIKFRFAPRADGTPQWERTERDPETGVQKRVKLHEIIAGGPAVPINGDWLDLRRENLRVLTNGEQKARTRRGRSGLIGVSYHKQSGRWQADTGGRTRTGRRSYELFPTAIEAAVARDEYARKQGLPLNFPDVVPDAPPVEHRTSDLRGVYWNPWDKCWEARVYRSTRYRGRKILLGCFEADVEAGRARDKHVYNITRSVVDLNFPEQYATYGQKQPVVIKLGDREGWGDWDWRTQRELQEQLEEDTEPTLLSRFPTFKRS